MRDRFESIPLHFWIRLARYNVLLALTATVLVARG